MRKVTTMTPKQLAQQRGVTLSYVYHELWANRLPGARKVGKAWLIPVTETKGEEGTDLTHQAKQQK